MSFTTILDLLLKSVLAYFKPTPEPSVDWRVYLLLSLLLLLGTLMVRLWRYLMQRLESLEQRVTNHYLNCDKPDKDTVKDVPEIKIGLAKVMSICGREFKGKYGAYVWNHQTPPERIPGESKE